MKLNSSAAALATASILLAASSVAAQSIAETRTTVFDGVVKTVSEQFYDPAFHGVDWVAVQARYRARLDQVANDADLQQLIAQMLGELKSSHLYLARTVPGIRHVGVGARIEPVDGADTVLELAPLSDARTKGLRPGDQIVGGVAALKGPAGSLADVTVQRCDSATARLKIRRESWLFPEEHPGLRWARIRVAPDKVIGYIRADRFDDGVAELADQAMAELGRTQGLVIDVRANSGGNISFLRLASYFIEGGGPFAALLSRPYLERLGRTLTPADIAAAAKVIGRYRGEDVAEALSKGGGAALFHLEDLGEKRYRAPVVVLIGPGTGSAAEGFAWTMKIRSTARLLGAPTAGAILSGEDFDIAPGWSLTVPVAGSWSPSGEDFNDKPVTPHEIVRETRADLCAGRDRGAERAMAILTEGKSLQTALAPAQQQEAVCWEQLRRRTAREQAARDAEPKDPDWAYSMEQKLREYTTRRIQPSRIQLLAIDCKTTFCEIGAHGLAPETAVEFSKAMSDVLGQQWNDFTDLSGDDTNSGKGLYRAQVRRKLNDVQRTALLAEEQAEAACFDRALEPQKREYLARETEPRDSSWADPMEQLLRQHIESQLRKHPVASLDVACRSTFCRIKATGKAMDSKEVFRKVAQEAAAEAWSDLSVSTSGGGSSGDGWHQEVTLNRRNSSR